MDIAPFALERYFARHEFSARWLLSSSDCEALSLAELLAMADAETERLWRELRLAYTESQGHPLLREAIADLHGGVAADDIQVVVPAEGIFLTMHALLAPGDHVVCVAPAYQSLSEVARSIGCEVSAWQPDEGHGWSFDLADLEALLRPTTRLVVCNFPHNPTGFVPELEDFAALVELVDRHGAHLLSDEMYRLLEIEPGTTLPPACALSGRAISLSGLSKSFGLPGLRLGWLACRDREVLQRIAVLKDYTTICAPAPSEVLAMIALRNVPRIHQRQIELARSNLLELEDFLARWRSRFEWHRPRGGSVCFPRYLGPESTTGLAAAAVERAGIMLVPSEVFGWGERHLRIGYGRADFGRALGELDGFLDQR